MLETILGSICKDDSLSQIFQIIVEDCLKDEGVVVVVVSSGHVALGL